MQKLIFPKQKLGMRYCHSDTDSDDDNDNNGDDNIGWVR